MLTAIATEFESQTTQGDANQLFKQKKKENGKCWREKQRKNVLAAVMITLMIRK